MVRFSKTRMMKRISKDDKFFFLALDQGLEHGPSDFNSRTVNPQYIISLSNKMRITGLILQKGLAIKYNEIFSRKVPLILKLNGKTKFTKGDPLSPQIATVKDAMELGASAVGYTVYIGSEHEAEMFEVAGSIESEARRHGLPFIIWAYPRGKRIKNQNSPKIIEYSARVALELGADIAKVHYTGDVTSFKKVVNAAGRCKIVSAGGLLEKLNGLYKDAKNVMLSGADGMAIGRNIWQHDDPVGVANSVASIIFDKELV